MSGVSHCSGDRGVIGDAPFTTSLFVSSWTAVEAHLTSPGGLCAINCTASLILSSGLSSAMVSLLVIGDGVVPSGRLLQGQPPCLCRVATRGMMTLTTEADRTRPVPPASTHGGPPPRDQAWMARADRTVQLAMPARPAATEAQSAPVSGSRHRSVWPLEDLRLPSILSPLSQLFLEPNN